MCLGTLGCGISPTTTRHNVRGHRDTGLLTHGNAPEVFWEESCRLPLICLTKISVQRAEYEISSHPSTHTLQRSPRQGSSGPAQWGHTPAGTCVRPARCTVGCQAGVEKQTANSCCSLCLEHAFILILPGPLSSHHSASASRSTSSGQPLWTGPSALSQPSRRQTPVPCPRNPSPPAAGPCMCVWPTVLRAAL